MPLLATFFDRWTVSSVGSAIRTNSAIACGLLADYKDITASVYVEELLNGASKTGGGIAQSEDENKTEDGDDASDSSGLLSRLFGG